MLDCYKEIGRGSLWYKVTGVLRNCQLFQCIPYHANYAIFP